MEKDSMKKSDQPIESMLTPFVKDKVAQEIKGPIVFFCKGCNSIISDSLLMVGHAPNPVRGIIFSGANHVSIEQSNLQTSDQQGDRGSTYCHLKCLVCERHVGRFYLTTTRSMDVVRELFTLLSDEIGSYALGTFTLESNVDVPPVTPSQHNSETVKNEEFDVAKLHHIILAQQERLDRIDAQLGLRNQSLNGTAHNHSSSDGGNRVDVAVSSGDHRQSTGSTHHQTPGPRLTRSAATSSTPNEDTFHSGSKLDKSRESGSKSKSNGVDYWSNDEGVAPAPSHPRKKMRK